MTDLTTVIDQLTHPHDVPVYRGQQYIRTRTDPPLLTALEHAAASSIGSGGQRRPRAERIQLNIAASELNARITRMIRAWARQAGYQPPRTGWPATRLVLRRWYALTRTSPDFTNQAGLLTAYAHQIRELVTDPPARWTLNAACPICGNRWADTPEGIRVDALQVTDRDPATDSDILCRNCHHQWDGINGARQLALAIDQQKTA